MYYKMSHYDLCSKLCVHDIRNPLYDIFVSDEHDESKQCYCDNCFYGRDVLALEIFKLKELLEEERAIRDE